MNSYRPEIDGLRAVAIVPVVFFHAGFSAFEGGYIGVDIFFVISGYLITSIILRDLAHERFSFGEFFERRARRILPALFLIMSLCIPFSHWLMLPHDFREFAETAAAVALFVSNLLFIDRLDYFAPAAELNPLLHTWSLAVEEQFYILFPPMLFLAWRWGGRRAAFFTALALFVCSFLLSEYAWRVKPAQTFFFFPTRAWELLAGALCAFALSSEQTRNCLYTVPRTLREVLGLAGLGSLLLAIWLYDKTILFPSYATLLPVLGVVALILFAGPETAVGRLLAWRGLVAIGLVSYSAYLWHQPLFAFARIAHGSEPHPSIMLMLCVLTFVLATGSWFYVEQPFRFGARATGPWLPERRNVFSASAISIAVFLIFGLMGIKTDGRANLWLAQASEIERQTYLVLQKADQITRRSDDSKCRFNAENLDDATIARLRGCEDQHGPGIAVLGDSHAIDLTEALLSATDQPFLFGLTRGGCRPDTPRKECSYDRFLSFLSEHPGLFERAIFESAGQHLVQDSAGRSGERLFIRYGPKTEINLDSLVFREEAISAIGYYLQRLAQHVPVIWLTPRIEMHLPDRHIMVQGCDYAFELRPRQAELFAHIASLIEETQVALENVHVVNQMIIIDLKMPEDFLTCERSLWTDADHLSAVGRIIFGERLAPFLLPEK